MTITVVASAADNHDTSASAFTPAKPSGATSGDVMIATVGAIGASVTFTAPSGWTLIATEAANTNVVLATYYKIAGGSEPSSYTWTPSISVKGFGAITAYRGVDTSSPIDAHASNTVTSSSATATPAVTAGVANAWVTVSAIGRHAFAAARTWSNSDGSDAQRQNHGSTSGSGFDYAYYVGDSNRALSAGSVSRTLTISTSTENQISWQAVSLKPAGAALTARVYRALVAAPVAAVALRARVYMTRAQAPTTGGKARIYRTALQAPSATPVSNSGFYSAKGGNVGRASVYVDTDGHIQ